MSTISVRPISKNDQDEWRTLWSEYLTFYKTTLPESVYDMTFQRLLTDERYDPMGLVAEQDGAVVGLVHYLQHRHCWRHENVIYLQDLYTAAACRGQGVGRALIEAVYARCDAGGLETVYWTTENTNVTAMRLYEKIGTRTGFIKYQR